MDRLAKIGGLFLFSSFPRKRLSTFFFWRSKEKTRGWPAFAGHDEKRGHDEGRKHIFSRSCAIVLSAGLLGATLTGCIPEYVPEEHGEGDSVQRNFLTQAVNPMPNQTVSAPDEDGQRATAAYQRYREDKVIKPVTSTTFTVGGGGGGGGGK